MKNKKININRSWIIDFIVFLMIIALAIVDGCFIQKNIKSYCKIFPETTALVCVLLLFKQVQQLLQTLFFSPFLFLI